MANRKILIVNADDFGLENEVNSAIIKAHRQGVVTSASLIANGAAFEDAVELARQNASLDVGVHLTLTRGPSLSGGPLLAPVEVPSLVKGDGLFPQNPMTLTARIMMGLISFAQVEREFRAQMERIRSAGIRITHIDSHQHIHVVPPVFRIVARLAREFDVKWLRLPTAHIWPGGGPPVGALRRLQADLLAWLAARNAGVMSAAGLRASDHYFGFHLAGRLLEDEIERVVWNLPEGTTELSCHPGADDVRLERKHPWGYKWERELAALCSPRVREGIEKAGVRLTGYSGL
ncbi:MAG: ChbG/HpnK family deacetylase [Candidatus Lindowbacteria bacterium]|nr:ChbG/HpnK family deacetylase [Candidatus Lindowbacteria bacterium]